MTTDPGDDAHEAAVNASRTLTELDRQLAARHDVDPDCAEAGAATPPADGAVGWAELEGDLYADDDVVARLAADSVIATNRALGQRSLHEFLRQ